MILDTGLSAEMLNSQLMLYMCSDCSYKTVRKNDYLRHKLVHSGERKYKCLVCGKRFGHSWVLKRHLLTVHPDVMVI
ncbi:unnamed protein product [Larinioides sclopetarius]|uniref:C2H2-type domain-containing protein n=1 Tax=Larinioides sclopetarius TaxID=280406 RepID=A0AAV2BCC1_9ARAC